MYGTDLYRRLRHGDRARPGMAGGRVAPPGVAPSAPRGAAPPVGLGIDVRTAAGARLHRRGARPVPRSVRPCRRARRRVPADRRPAQPVRPDDGARRRRPGRGRRDRHRHAGHRHRRRSSAAGRRRVTHVETDRGRPIECEIVVNAGGMYSHEIGRMAGVKVPIVPMAHQYAITRPAEDVPARLPTMRDPDRLVYFREEVGGLIVGGYERDPDPWCVDGNIPADVQQHTARPGLGPLRAARRGRPGGRAGARRRRRRPARQRARGVHARRRVHPRRERASPGSSSPPGSAPTASPAPAASAR